MEKIFAINKLFKKNYRAICKNFFTRLLIDYFVFYYICKIIFIKKNKYGNFINHKFRSSKYRLFILKNDRNVPLMLLAKQRHKIDYIYNHSIKNNTQKMRVTGQKSIFGIKRFLNMNQ